MNDPIIEANTVMITTTIIIHPENMGKSPFMVLPFNQKASFHKIMTSGSGNPNNKRAMTKIIFDNIPIGNNRKQQTVEMKINMEKKHAIMVSVPIGVL